MIKGSNGKNGFVIWLKFLAVSPNLVNTFICSQVLGCVLALFGLGSSFQELSTASFPYISPGRLSKNQSRIAWSQCCQAPLGQLTQWLTHSLSPHLYQVTGFLNPKMDSFFLQLMCIWNSSFGGMLGCFLNPGDSERYNHLVPTWIVVFAGDNYFLQAPEWAARDNTADYLGYLISEKCAWAGERSLPLLNYKNLHGFMWVYEHKLMGLWSSFWNI